MKNHIGHHNFVSILLEYLPKLVCKKKIFLKHYMIFTQFFRKTEVNYLITIFDILKEQKQCRFLGEQDPQNLKNHTKWGLL